MKYLIISAWNRGEMQVFEGQTEQDTLEELNRISMLPQECYDFVVIKGEMVTLFGADGRYALKEDK